jgi:hypothetical protein
VGLGVMRKRRWLLGGPPAPRPPNRPGRDPLGDRPCRRVFGHIHDPSQPKHQQSRSSPPPCTWRTGGNVQVRRPSTKSEAASTRTRRTPGETRVPQPTATAEHPAARRPSGGHARTLGRLRWCCARPPRLGFERHWCGAADERRPEGPGPGPGCGGQGRRQATVEVVYDPGLRTWAPPDDQLQPDPAHLVGVLHRPQPLAQRTMPSTWAR